MRKIYKHKELLHKVLCEWRYTCQDEFGWPDDKRHEFEFYFKVSRVFTLSGIVYRVEVPDFTAHDKDKFTAVWRAIKHVHEDGPRYYRLKEELYRKGIMKQL